MAESPQKAPANPPDSPDKPCQDLPMFGFIISIVLVLIPFTLQANGVEMNWWISAVIYLFSTVLGGCSIWYHAIPHWKPSSRITLTLLWFLIIGGLGCYATHKQFRRDQLAPSIQENRPHIRVLSCIAYTNLAGPRIVINWDNNGNQQLINPRGKFILIRKTNGALVTLDLAWEVDPGQANHFDSPLPASFKDMGKAFIVQYVKYNDRDGKSYSQTFYWQITPELYAETIPFSPIKISIEDRSVISNFCNDIFKSIK